MDDPITCPACAESFIPAADPRGRKVVCTQCGQRLVVTSAGIVKRDEASPAIAAQTRRPPPKRPGGDSAVAASSVARRWIAFVSLFFAVLLLLCGGTGWYLLSSRKSEVAKGIGPLHSMKFSPDGKTLAAPVGQAVLLWDVNDLKRISVLSGHSDRVMVVSFKPDSKTLVSGNMDQTIKVWDLASGENTATLNVNSGPVRSLAFNRDGATLASGSSDGTVMLWDVGTQKKTATFSTATTFSPEDFKGYADSLAFAPDGKTLYTYGFRDPAGLFYSWNLSDAQQKPRLIAENRGSGSIAVFGADGKTATTWPSSYSETECAEKSVKLAIWDLPSGNKTSVRAPHLIEAVALAPDGKTLAVAHPGENNALTRVVTLFDIRTNRSIARLDVRRYRDARGANEEFMTSLAFSPDGSLLALALVAFNNEAPFDSNFKFKEIKLFDVTTRKCLATLR